MLQSLFNIGLKNLKDFVLNVRDPESSLREATESSLTTCCWRQYS